MKKKIIEQVLCDTTRDVSYDEYLDYCELNEEEPQGEESNDFYEFRAKAQNWEWDDFMEQLPYMYYTDWPWLITGSIGRWNGRYDVYPTMEKSLEDAIRSCIGRDTMDVKIKREGHTIIVIGHHHDGTNYFELHALTDKGAERFERHGEVSLSNRENVQKLPKELWR